MWISFFTAHVPGAQYVPVGIRTGTYYCTAREPVQQVYSVYGILAAAWSCPSTYR